MSQSQRAESADVGAMAAGVLAGDRAMLARAITLIESDAPRHHQSAQELLSALLPKAGSSIRIGITGAPGVGKSTFIDRFGCFLGELGSKVAVLAIDPSSSRSHGSILGDKTRMEKLSRAANAFIRPTPAAGILGGVAATTRESILLCEAAGYDIVIVETVGTGQSEIALRALVDMLLLMQIAGAGDELQGIKKGVIELCDGLIINKADGDNALPAEASRAEFNRALHLLPPATPGWTTRACTASAVTGRGIAQIWRMIQDFVTTTKASGEFEKRRRSQLRAWLHDAVDLRLKRIVAEHDALQAALPRIEAAVMRGELPAAAAADQLLQLLWTDP